MLIRRCSPIFVGCALIVTEKIFQAPANSAEVGHLPVQASELAASDSEAKLDSRLAVLRTATLLAAGTAAPAHALIQLDEEGDALSAQCCSLSNCSFGTSVLLGHLFRQFTPRLRSTAVRADLCNKAVQSRKNFL